MLIPCKSIFALNLWAVGGADGDAKTSSLEAAALTPLSPQCAAAPHLPHVKKPKLSKTVLPFQLTPLDFLFYLFNNIFSNLNKIN